MRRLLLVSLLVMLTACGSSLYRWEETQGDARADQAYEVQKGDTLYSIAFRYGLDFRQLAKWNDIGSDYTIYPGQQLSLLPGDGSLAAAPREPTRPAQAAAPPSPRATTSSGITWQWPTEGSLLATFGANNATGKGIDIGGIVGDDVRAAAAGKVVYAGSGLIGYGKIIIIKHSEEFLSAYGHNSELFVSEGEQVEQGERIAKMGRGPESRPLLHFEIRINGKAVDPLPYLPAR
ncbi:MAG: peptidoglycan DD-metalloendopeptidase family protein [Gammaproteobacteria bacterium]|nr:peptidoglycan DD-metalloendopeptidase family protein [Gammaproteobacteria bacterium]